MRVGLISLIAAGHDGIPRYAAKLVEAMDSVSSEFPELELMVVAHPPAAEKLRVDHLEVLTPAPLRRFTARRGPGRIVAEQLGAAASRCDLVHFFDLTLPLLHPNRPFVATVHDAAPVHRFEGSPKLHKRLTNPAAARRARALIAVSNFARDEAIEHYRARPERVRVVYSGPGLSPEGGRSEPGGEGRGRAGTERGDYFLYVGSLFEHKNLSFLVRAFERTPPGVKLVIVGNPAHASSALQAALASSSATGRIEFIPNASDAELDGLYRHAKALVLPSVYEGFGFTALEAMARGCPALVSDIPALREVCGAGAMLLPLSDEAAWAQAMTRMLDPADGLRGELVRRASSAVAAYSWEKTAREICQLYTELAAEPKRAGRQAGSPAPVRTGGGPASGR